MKAKSAVAKRISGEPTGHCGENNMKPNRIRDAAAIFLSHRGSNSSVTRFEFERIDLALTSARAN